MKTKMKTKMRILIFNWRDITHPWSGGAEVYIHEIGKRLVKKGYDITLFCGEYLGCEEETVIDGIKIIRKGGQYSLYLYAPIYYLLKLRKNIDIIIDCENGIPFFTPLFSRKKKICVVHHIHRDVFDKELPFYLSWLGKFLEGFLMPLVYKKIDFVAVSPSTKKAMINLGINKENIRLIYNGMNGQFAPDFSKKKSNLIAYVGRIKRYKQLDHLVKAFRIVKDKIQDAELVIAGKGNLVEIEELAKRLNLKICLYNGITDEEKFDLLQKAKVFVTTSMKEGWGLTVIEANRCGTPVVAYDVDGLRDSIRNNETGLLVKSGDIRQIGESIIKIIDNNDLQMNIRALEWSKKFDWDKSTEEFEKAIESLC